MPGKGGNSNGKSSKKGKAPKHQNKFAFRDHKHQAEYWSKIKSAPSPHLCARCREQIEWKKQYHKYKPLKQPAKCCKCEMKTVRHAYHVMCQPCAKKLSCCAKCQTKEGEIKKEAIEEAEEEEKFEKELQESIKHLSERERRKVLRELAKDSDSEEEEEGEEEEQEEGGGGGGGEEEGVDQVQDQNRGDKEAGADGDAVAANKDETRGISASENMENITTSNLKNEEEGRGEDNDDLLLSALEEANRKLKLVDGDS